VTVAVDLESLLIEETKEAIYTTALDVATAVGVPVDTWQAGDPTRSLFHVEAEFLATLETLVANFIRSGFLDYAEDVWLKILAEQMYGVEVPEATFASTTVTLTNPTGGNYPIDPGDLLFKNSTTDKTYRNTTGGTLTPGPGTTLDVTVEAEEAGSDSSAAAGEIDTIVSGPAGVTCTNATAAVGSDEQEDDTTRQQCRDKLGALSPNGPAAAYSYVARNAELTGTSAVTRVRVYSDSDTGDVTVYLAGSSGGVAEPDRVLVEEAIATWATPLCITPEVLAATNVSVAVTYTVWVYASANKTQAEVEEDVEAALEALFAAHPIGGDIISPATTGSLYKSLIESTILSVYPEAFRVSVSAPAGDTALTNGQVAVLGTVTATVNIEVDP
jgi:uncharacterized phage protein gp47/JayE